MEREPPGVFLALPSYSQEVHRGSARGAYCRATKRCRTVPAEVTGSLLAFVFNHAWGAALMSHARGEVTYFAMLHSDITPEPFWLDTLIDELERLQADVVSVVIPIKGDPRDPDPLTSTGIDDPSNRWKPKKRFTINQVSTFPSTFNSADCGYPNDALLVNTGLWVCDLRKPWTRATNKSGAAKFYFTINDRVEIERDGTVSVRVEPEDWYMSRRLHSLGCKVYATTKVKADHGGSATFPNFTAGAAGRT